MPRRKREQPWWTGPGAERCSVCLMAYHYEAEYRCAGCDRSLCPDCAARGAASLAVVEILCSDCAAEAEPAAEAS